MALRAVVDKLPIRSRLGHARRACSSAQAITLHGCHHENYYSFMQIFTPTQYKEITDRAPSPQCESLSRGEVDEERDLPLGCWNRSLKSNLQDAECRRSCCRRLQLHVMPGCSWRCGVNCCLLLQHNETPGPAMQPIPARPAPLPSRIAKHGCRATTLHRAQRHP